MKINFKNQQWNAEVKLYCTPNDLSHIYRKLHPTAAEYTLSEYGTLSKLEHMLCNKTNVNKLKNVIISCIFSDCNKIKPVINKMNHRNYKSIQDLYTMFYNKQNKEIKNEF
jgi:hypothetical protein